MLGTDTFAPRRWHYVADSASENLGWLNLLPAPPAARIAGQNALELLKLHQF